MKYAIFLIVIALSELLIEPLLRKRLNIKRKEIFSLYRPHTTIQQWGEIALLAIALIFLKENPLLLMFSFIFILTNLRGFMAWKHQKEEKEYIPLFFQSSVSMLAFGILLYI